MKWRNSPTPQAKPGGWFDGKTLADYVDWMIVRAGHSGRLQIARKIEQFTGKREG
jgi:hypothetical protein